MVSSNGMVGPASGSIPTARSVFLLKSLGYNWEDCFGTCCRRGPVEEGVTGVQESFGDVASDDF